MLLDVSLNHFATLFLETKSSIEPGIHQLGYSALQCSPGICLSWPLSDTHHWAVPLFYFYLGPGE